MKAIRLITVAFCLSLLSSCTLLNSLLKVPVGLLQAVGRTAGIGLTDEAPQPITDEDPETIEKAAEKRESTAE